MPSPFARFAASAATSAAAVAEALPLLLALPAPTVTAATPASGSHSADKASASTRDERLQRAASAGLLWLVGIDGDQWGRAWETGHPQFQADNPREKWETTMIRIRGLLGGVEKRKLAASGFKRNPPGLPEGEYAVLQFIDQFEHRSRGAEIVTLAADRDGNWRVVAYVIR